VAREKIQQFLSGVGVDSIDLLLSGDSGDERYAPLYTYLHETCSGSSMLAFKRLTGEYGTATAAGLSLLADMVQKQSFPAQILGDRMPANPRRVVMISNYLDHYSCWLIEVVR